MERKIVITQTIIDDKISNISIDNPDKISAMEVMGILRYLEKRLFVQACKEHDIIKTKLEKEKE